MPFIATQLPLLLCRRRSILLIMGSLLALLPSFAQASELNGAALSPLLAIPFAGILLSVAIGPLVVARFWHHHYGKVIAGWTLIFLIPFTFKFGISGSVELITHAVLAEYVPFLVLLFALFTISGGIFIRGTPHSSPRLNTGILALGALLAPIMGTTGAAMLLIRPLLRANDNRRHNAHVPIFFIFLVANVGGSVTPLGDPPLFLGFLHGVDFFWTLEHMLVPALGVSVPLLVIFYLLDSYLFNKPGEIKAIDPTPYDEPRLNGKINFALLGGVALSVLVSGMWHPGIEWNIFGTHLELEDLSRDLVLLALAGISMRVTPQKIRERNNFNWEPIVEVAKLFAGIFVTIGPVIAMIQAGPHGPFGALLHTVNDDHGHPLNLRYFWITGLLSGFLDNGPTYLLFFNMAGGDPQTMMGPLSKTLLAISMGSVFMGALTYIGNAPNLMVKFIAQQRGVKMPEFFGYMAWSCGILLPVLAIVSFALLS